MKGSRGAICVYKSVQVKVEPQLEEVQVAKTIYMWDTLCIERRNDLS